MQLLLQQKPRQQQRNKKTASKGKNQTRVCDLLRHQWGFQHHSKKRQTGITVQHIAHFQANTFTSSTSICFSGHNQKGSLYFKWYASICFSGHNIEAFLVPSFPCLANIYVSLMEKDILAPNGITYFLILCFQAHVYFGLKISRAKKRFVLNSSRVSNRI
jgi:hypothetical protein